MIPPGAVTAGIRFVRAEEAWEPVVFGAMIPVIGAVAVLGVLWHAVRDNPEDDPPLGEPGGEDRQEGGAEDPPSGAT